MLILTGRWHFRRLRFEIDIQSERYSNFEHFEGKRAIFENYSFDVEFDGYIQESIGDWI